MILRANASHWNVRYTQCIQNSIVNRNRFRKWSFLWSTVKDAGTVSH